MVQTIVKVASYLGISKKLISYVLTIVITVSLTIPTTLTIQSATAVKVTLDTVVVNQKKLERSLNKVFNSVGERIDYIERTQHRFIDTYLRSERIQNEVILSNSIGDPKYPVFKEKIMNLERMQRDFLAPEKR